MNSKILLVRRAIFSLIEKCRGTPPCEGAPLTWLGALDEEFEGHIAPLALRNFLSDDIFFTTDFSFQAALRCALGKKVAVLSWGAGHFSGFRGWIVKFIVRRATRLYVNDPTSAAELTAITARNPHVVPFGVDTDFFHPDSQSPRGEFCFCAGSQRRDGKLLLALAERGIPVVWLNNAPLEDLAEYTQHPNFTIVQRISFIELRELYRQAKIVLSPLIDDSNAAGQTTSLEALACGACVIMSAGRTAEIFDATGLVEVIDDNDPDRWSAALKDASVSFAGKTEHWHQARRAIIVNRWSVKSAAAELAASLRNIG